jgi:hypothetical protein
MGQAFREVLYMILADFECSKCNTVTEHYVDAQQKTVECKCGGKAKKIISLPGVYVNSENPNWLKSVIDVVDKEDKRPHVQEFLKHPTRENYKRWMKEEKIRPVDWTVHGAPPTYQKPPEPDIDKIAHQIHERLRERQRLELYA